VKKQVSKKITLQKVKICEKKMRERIAEKGAPKSDQDINKRIVTR